MACWDFAEDWGLQRDERLTAISAVFACGEELADLLDRSMRVIDLPHRSVLGHQGDPLDQCWLMLDGAVHVQLIGWDGQRVQLAYHGPGEIFGAYPEPSTHRADIVVEGEAQALRIATTALAGLADAHAPIAAGLARLLARQLDMALDRMAARTTLSAAGRVYAELMRMADKEHRIRPQPKVTALGLSANVSRETASRAIAVLERRGIVRRDSDAWTIVAPRMLADMIS
jgi:CRP/FNR family cyclic AMP-dependent transcriptional regulator